jgi:hypothetical protein
MVLQVLQGQAVKMDQVVFQEVLDLRDLAEHQVFQDQVGLQVQAEQADQQVLMVHQEPQEVAV